MSPNDLHGSRASESVKARLLWECQPASVASVAMNKGKLTFVDMLDLEAREEGSSGNLLVPMCVCSD